MYTISDLPILDVNEESFEYLPIQNKYQETMRLHSKILTEHKSSNYGEKMRKILNLVPEYGSVVEIWQKKPEFVEKVVFQKNNLDIINEWLKVGTEGVNKIKLDEKSGFYVLMYGVRQSILIKENDWIMLDNYKNVKILGDGILIDKKWFIDTYCRHVK